MSDKTSFTMIIFKVNLDKKIKNSMHNFFTFIMKISIKIMKDTSFYPRSGNMR